MSTLSTPTLPTLQAPSAYTQPKLKCLPLREQPAFRVTQSPEHCSLTELLAAVVGGPHQIEIAEALVMQFGGDIRRLYHAHPVELSRIRGINQAIAVRIKAALNLGVRLNEYAAYFTSISSPADAASVVQNEMSLLEQEHLRVLLLNTRNHLLEVVEVYHGSVNSSQVRVGEVFRAAVQRMASAIIVVHNHPSGDPTPSPDDVAVTRAILQAGNLMDIKLLDHIVIGQGSWVSLKERGLGFS